MSEERTQAPSPRRRQLAREQGQVARSPDLTGAVGLLAALLLLGAYGGELAAALVAAVREPLEGAEGPGLVADPAEVVARLRRAAAAVAVPLGWIGGGTLAAIVAAHQLQVRGLWAPALLAPRPERLWGGAAGADLTTRLGRGAWAVAKAVAVIGVAAWAIRSQGPQFDQLSGLSTVALARAAGALLRALMLRLALAGLALGALDFALQYRRIEALLRLTPEQYREDQRAIDGDPALRARRQRVAQSWRREPGPDVLAGAAMVLTGPLGLSVLLGGGPPPRRLRVLALARGPGGAALRRAAARAGVPAVAAPRLALHFAGSAGRAALPPDLAAELAERWPQSA